MKRLVLTFLITTLLITSLAHAKLTHEEAYQLASDAQMAFRQGNEQVQYDTAAAENFYDQAILRYQKIIEEGGIANQYLYYNIGNVYLLKGDIGRAILNYKRAEKIGGTNTNLEQNISFARGKRLDQIPVKAEKRVMRTLFFWHYDISLKTRFLIACSLWVLLWLTAMPWLLSRRYRFIRWFTLVTALITICFAFSVFLETYHTYQNPQGVILADSVIARQGDGENYAESFKQPLHAGTEFDLLEKRSGWLRIRLANDAQTWIPSQSADII